VYFPVDLIVCVIIVYILTPFCALKVGVLVLIGGELNGDYKVTKATDAQSVPMLKLFENLGEAIPQAILCIVFIISHIFAPLRPQPESSTETKFLFFKKKNYIY